MRKYYPHVHTSSELLRRRYMVWACLDDRTYTIEHAIRIVHDRVLIALTWRSMKRILDGPEYEEREAYHYSPRRIHG